MPEELRCPREVMISVRSPERIVLFSGMSAPVNIPKGLGVPLGVVHDKVKTQAC